MIAARTPTTITQTIESEPCDASTEQAISTVSPGTGRPNDSSVSSTNNNSIAHWLCCSRKLVIEARGMPETIIRHPFGSGASALSAVPCENSADGSGRSSERRAPRAALVEAGACSRRALARGLLLPGLPARAHDRAEAELASRSRSDHGRRCATRDAAVRRPLRCDPRRRRCCVRLVDSCDDRSATRGKELLPPHLRRRSQRQVVRPHTHVRLA